MTSRSKFSSALQSTAGGAARAAVIAFCLPTTSLADDGGMPVTAVVARQDAVTERLDVVGTLAPREEIQVHSAVLGREIREIVVEAGQHVSEGQALARLDTTDVTMLLSKNAIGLLRAKAAVSVERSRVDVALIGEEEARRKLDRSLALQPKGAIADTVLEDHRNAYARAGAELRLARQSLDLAEAEEQMIVREREEIRLTLERSTIRAPSAGLILSRNARIGAMTSTSGEPLFLIADNDEIEFVAQVTETSFVRLRQGMRAEVTLPGLAQPVTGIIRLNAAQLDPKTRSGTVRVALSGREGLIPGVFARGTIDLDERRNIVVPSSAVRSAGGTSNVYVVSDGIVDMRQVRIGSSQGGLVEIVEGIRDGETVALKAGAFLKAAERVKLVVVTAPALEAREPARAAGLGDGGGALVR